MFMHSKGGDFETINLSQSFAGDTISWRKVTELMMVGNHHQFRDLPQLDGVTISISTKCAMLLK
jgi:hypothetical protein